MHCTEPEEVKKKGQTAENNSVNRAAGNAVQYQNARRRRRRRRRKTPV